MHHMLYCSVLNHLLCNEPNHDLIHCLVMLLLFWHCTLR